MAAASPAFKNQSEEDWGARGRGGAKRGRGSEATCFLRGDGEKPRPPASPSEQRTPWKEMALVALARELPDLQFITRMGNNNLFITNLGKSRNKEKTIGNSTFPRQPLQTVF